MSSQIVTMFCTVVGQLLIADGCVTDEERDYLYGLFERYGVESEAQQQIIAQIDLTADFDAGLDSLSAEQREELLALLKEAASSDGRVAAVEQDVIRRVEAVHPKSVS